MSGFFPVYEGWAHKIFLPQKVKFSSPVQLSSFQQPSSQNIIKSSLPLSKIVYQHCGRRLPTPHFRKCAPCYFVTKFRESAKGCAALQHFAYELMQLTFPWVGWKNPRNAVANSKSISFAFSNSPAVGRERNWQLQFYKCMFLCLALCVLQCEFSSDRGNGGRFWHCQKKDIKIANVSMQYW